MGLFDSKILWLRPKAEYYNLGSESDWLTTSPMDHIKVGGGGSFQGSLSCLQLFKQGLNPAQLKHHKKCPTASSRVHSTPCPDGGYYYDGMCYKVSSHILTSYSSANMLGYLFQGYNISIYTSALVSRKIKTIIWEHIEKIFSHFVLSIKAFKNYAV